MSSYSILLVTFLCLTSTFSSIDAAFPNINFNTQLATYTTNNNWCSACQAFSGAFSNNQCFMGCAGDNGGGGGCPADACPRVFTFTSQNNIPIWNIQSTTTVDPNVSPYRTFSYIPICYAGKGVTGAQSCTEPFYFSFSVKYTQTAGTTPIFNGASDYLKLLFWGDGNNMLAIKQGQLLGVPNGGSADLVGQANTGANEAFKMTFPSNTWMNIAVKITFNADKSATLGFFVNGQAMGSTTKTIKTADSGLQFGAYKWGASQFNLQYTNIAFTPVTQAVPNPIVAAAGTTTAPPATTTAPPATTTKPPTTTTAPATTTKPPSSTTAPATTANPGATSGPGAVDAITLVTPPSTIPQTGSFTIQLQYINSAKTSRSLVAQVLQPSSSGYTTYGMGFVNVASGASGTVPVTITMGTLATPGLFYTINYFMVDASIFQNGVNMNAYKSATVANTFSVTVTGTIIPTSTPTAAGTTPDPNAGIPDPTLNQPTFPVTGTDPPSTIIKARNSATSASTSILSLLICSVIVLLL